MLERKKNGMLPIRQKGSEERGDGVMYIAVCDDQTEELGSLTELIGAWEEDRARPCA